MASGRRPSILMMSTRRATGRGVGLMVGVTVGAGVRVTVGGGSVGCTVTVGLAVGISVAKGVGITVGVAGRQALINSILNMSKENSRVRE